jgi:hypothetical protein
MPITMDSAFAEDTDTTDDELPGDNGSQFREQVGRFVPVVETTTTVGAPSVNDFDPNGTYDLNDTAKPHWNYRWARRLFDYLTVQSPNDDYLASAPKTINGKFDPVLWPQVTGEAEAGPPAVRQTPLPQPPPAPPREANRLTEEAATIDGLININTAPWVVLKQIPWVPQAGTGKTDILKLDPASGKYVVGQDGIDDNEQIAREIVRWRDGEPWSGTPPKGPFTTIFDLYRVPAFQQLNIALVSTTEPDDIVGDITPPGNGTDHARFDFEEQTLALTRISNLITTRSDTFTVYIVVQGWQGSRLTVQRRTAFIVDRSKLAPATNCGGESDVKIINVPND